MKKISVIFYWLIMTILLVIALGIAISAANLPTGIRLYTVQSGSMEPTIKIGNLIIVKPVSQYQPNDIITFKREEDRYKTNPKITTTHRFIGVKDNLLITKGDANDTPDSVGLDPGLVIGKLIFQLPILGKPIAFAKTQTGFILLIIIPATLIVYSEILNIKKEIIKIRSRKKKK